MKKIMKRVLAWLLVVTILIGSVSAARSKAYAMSAAGVIAGTGVTITTGAAVAGLLGILGVVAASKVVYDNKDAITEWGSTQINRFKSWVGDNLEKLGWAVDSAAVGLEIDKWGEKLASGTLDKANQTWSAFKDWVQDDVYTDSGDHTYMLNGYPTLEESTSFFLGSRYAFAATGGKYYVFTYDDTRVFARGDTYIGIVSNQPLKYTYYRSDYLDNKYSYVLRSWGSGLYGMLMTISAISVDPAYEPRNYLGLVTLGSSESSFDKILPYIVDAWDNDFVGIAVPDDDREYTFVGGVPGVLGDAGTLDNVDVVGQDSEKDDTEVKLPWVDEGTLGGVLGGIQTGERDWTDVLDTTKTGVVEKTKEEDSDTTIDLVIGNEGTTTKEWEYAPAVPTTPDVTLPDTAEPSKELSSYTLAGLEKIFPFCLPFDLIDFLQVLDAPAEAPHFVIPIKYPTKDGLATYDMVIDLSDFDSIASLLRDMECLLFIVGLIMVTRSRMIRG